MIRLSTVADEQSTLALTIAFKDENGDDAVPSLVTWKLVDQDGEIVNEREEVPVTPISTTIKIILTGDDLALDSHAATRYKRILTVQAKYDSSAGSDLFFSEHIEFYVQSNIALP